MGSWGHGAMGSWGHGAFLLLYSRAEGGQAKHRYNRGHQESTGPGGHYHRASCCPAETTETGGDRRRDRRRPAAPVETGGAQWPRRVKNKKKRV